MPTSVSSSERLWGALRDAYYDDATPGRFSAQEWQENLKPALEAATDLNDESLQLLRALSVWNLTDPTARESIRRWLATESPKYLPGKTSKGALPIVESGRDAVFLRRDGVFTSDATGEAPADLAGVASALYRAAKFVEGGFRSKDPVTLFGKEHIDLELKEKAFAQLEKAMEIDVSDFAIPQRQQLRASVGALLIDLLRTLPSSGNRAAGLQSKVFNAIQSLLWSDGTPPVTRHILTGQMQSRDILVGLRPEQRAINDQALKTIAPEHPMDYGKLARRAAANGAIELNVHDTVGHGEGFLAGFGLNLQRDGWRLVEGSLPRGPAKYVLELDADDPRNAWGVPFVVNYTLQYENGHDIYEKMGDRNIDIVAYGGHSNLGRNKLNSLRNAPKQQGDKLILSDSCANADGMDAEYAHYPHAQNLASNQSTYFRVRNHPEYGKIAYESEGYSMKMTVLDGIIGKKNWKSIGDDLERRANWWGHGTSNNWITPDSWKRRFREVDGDNDGISDLFDMLPSFNTFDVEADTAAEFDLVIPDIPADEITANRAFQATRALNSFVNYNPVLSDNVWRDVIGDSQGIYFQAKEGDTELVRFRKVASPDGKPALAVQFSSALADMSVEALRFVLFHEYVMHEHGKRDLGRGVSNEEAKVMAVLFAASSLKYDMGWRDSQIFDRAKSLLNIPGGIDLWGLNAALDEADTERHNYMGDMPAVKKLMAEYAQNGVAEALKDPKASRPQTPARAA